MFITGPSTHRLEGQASNGLWRLSSSYVVVVVCSTRICNLTHHTGAARGWPVVLHPVRATPCCVSLDYFISELLVFVTLGLDWLGIMSPKCSCDINSSKQNHYRPSVSLCRQTL